MSPKKPYQKRLPTVMPPAPRRPPAQESLPAPATTQATATARGSDRALPSDQETRTVPVPVAAAVLRAPAPAPARAPTSPPRGRLVALAVGVAALAVGGAVASAIIRSGDPRPDDVPVTVDTLGAPRVLLPDESYVESRVLAGGDVVVRQWIRTDRPLQQVRLALPEVEGAETLQADGIVVESGGVRAVGPTLIAVGGATYTFTDTTELRIRYRLTGATEVSDRASGRALARATTMDVTYTPGIARDTRVVRASEVLALACGARSGAPVVPCGDADGTQQWQVDLTGRRVDDRVVAQVNLGQAPD